MDLWWLLRPGAYSFSGLGGSNDAFWCLREFSFANLMYNIVKNKMNEFSDNGITYMYLFAQFYAMAHFDKLN